MPLTESRLAHYAMRYRTAMLQAKIALDEAQEESAPGDFPEELSQFCYDCNTAVLFGGEVPTWEEFTDAGN